MLSSPSTIVKKWVPACWRESQSVPAFVPTISKTKTPANPGLDPPAITRPRVNPHRSVEVMHDEAV